LQFTLLSHHWCTEFGRALRCHEAPISSLSAHPGVIHWRHQDGGVFPDL
jgi:hypothetical protein